MPFCSAKTKIEESSLRTLEGSKDDHEKASQEADLLLSLAETASEHAQISQGREKYGIAVISQGNVTMVVSQNGHASSKSPVLTSTEKETQSGESSSTESTRSHVGHAYGWQRPYYYHHPYGGVHLPYPVPHYLMPISTEEVPASSLRPEKRVLLESIENPFSKDAKQLRLEGEESRQESSASQSPRSPADYKDDDDDDAEKSTKRESVISPASSNETQQITDTDSQPEAPPKASRPSTPGLTSDQSRQYSAYHGVHPQYMNYPPPHGFAAPHPFGHHYGAHPSIAYPFPPPPAPFYYRGGMMQSPPSSYKPTVSPTPPRPSETSENDKMTAMKGLVLAARSDLLKSFPADKTFPNYNRCIPLNQPLPGRRWSRDDEDAQQRAMPEFSQLVNFPDYLARGREGKAGVAACGKKNCVMCGKLRPSSVSTMSRRGGTGEEVEDEGTMHIIPRQNKGVCTACDVAVWAVTSAKLDDGLPVEIKWCKGCKNFRPWAAFGDKGMATKCVRCRNRQKEKYAAAKVSVKLELPQAIEAYAR